MGKKHRAHASKPKPTEKILAIVDHLGERMARLEQEQIVTREAWLLILDSIDKTIGELREEIRRRPVARVYFRFPKGFKLVQTKP